MKFLLLSLLLTISFTVVLVSQTAVFAQTEKKVGEERRRRRSKSE